MAFVVSALAAAAVSENALFCVSCHQNGSHCFENRFRLDFVPKRMVSDRVAGREAGAAARVAKVGVQAERVGTEAVRVEQTASSLARTESAVADASEQNIRATVNILDQRWQGKQKMLRPVSVRYRECPMFWG